MADRLINREDAESNLLDAATYLAESIPPGESHASAIAAVVPGYLANGNVDLAAELANGLDDPFMRDRLLIAVAAKCAELDDDEYALQLVEAIEDPGLQVQGYEQVGIRKADKGEFEKAGDIAALINHPDGILLRIAVRQAADGDETGALNTISEIEYQRDAVVAMNSIAAERIKLEDLEKAAEMLGKSAEKAVEIEHEEERIRSYCEIGNMLIDAAKNGQAVEVYETARAEAEELDNAHRDPLIAQTAIGFLKAGNVELADSTLDAVTDKTQIATVVLAFARDHWRKDEKEDAVEALEEAFALLRSQRQNETRDSRSKFALMGTIAAQFAGFGKGERAIEAAACIEDPRQRVNTISQIAAICIQQGDETLAREVLTTLGDISDRTSALIWMSDAAAEGDQDLSERLLREAEAAADQIELLGPKADMVHAISERYANAGLSEKVRSGILKLLVVVAEMRDEAVRVGTLAKAAELVEKTGLELAQDEFAAIRSLLGENRSWAGG
jgi:hypothetical protein